MIDRRGFLKQVLVSAATAPLAIRVLTSDSGCSAPVENNAAKPLQLNQFPQYFKNAYNNISIDGLTEEERKIAAGMNPNKHASELGDFIRENLQYVNIEQPSDKDRAFLTRYGLQLHIYREYSDISQKGFSEEERQWLNGLDRNGFAKALERELPTNTLDQFRIFMDLEHLKDADCVAVYRAIGEKYQAVKIFQKHVMSRD